MTQFDIFGSGQTIFTPGSEASVRSKTSYSGFHRKQDSMANFACGMKAVLATIQRAVVTRKLSV